MMRLEDVVDPAKHKTRLVPGYAAEDGMVSVGGLLQPAIWLAHTQAVVGDPVQIIIVERPDAPSMAVVAGVVGQYVAGSTRPREGTVATAATGSDEITVSTVSGSVGATFLATYTPAVSDRVRLLWQDGEATVLGKVGATAPKPVAEGDGTQPTQPPPSRKGKGRDTFTASNSGTWSTGTGSWNSYFGKQLYQGSYGSVGSNRGAWFYHNKPSKLRSKTATGAQIWVPKRMNAGSYNTTVTLNLYLHSSKRKPGGDVNRGSKTSVPIRKGWGGGWVDLPDSWGQKIIAGDGVGIAGGAYAGFAGVSGKGGDARSGQIRITWEG